MKKNLLFACLALTTTSFAQFTDANSPAIGNSATMYVLDTNASNMAGVTGTGVSWDYSSTPGVYGQTKSVSVLDATSTPDAADYAGAVIAIEIPGFLTSYCASNATTYSSQGFIFSEPSFGDVEARFNTNSELLLNYPAVVGDMVSDVVAGQIITTTAGTFPCTGTAKTTVDGSGTLKLNAATTLSNVLRFKIEDSLHVDAAPLGEVIMKRVQYEYYDHANSNLPVFVHSTIVLSVFGGPQTTGLVMSSVAPDSYLGVNSQELTNVTVYPNPATDFVNINGLKDDATVQIFSLNGQLVKTVELATGTTSIAIEDLNAGSYLVKATTSNGTLTTKITVQ